MSKLVLVSLPFVTFAACTTGPTEPLSALNGKGISISGMNDPASDYGSTTPSIDVVFGGGPVAVADNTGPCDRVSGLSGTFDGADMDVIHEGGWQGAFDGTYDCMPIELRLDNATATTGTSTITISDGGTTWTIEAGGLLANDFTLEQPPTREGQPAIVTWPSATTFLSAPYVQFLGSGGDPEEITTPVVTGNQVSFTVSPFVTTLTATIQIEAARDAVVTRCDGPGTCAATVSAGAKLAMTLH